MNVTTAMLLSWLRRTAEKIHEQRDILTELDAAIGDADHGINLDRGFSAVAEELLSVEDNHAGVILKSVGLRLIATVGGASGPLYGTAFRRAGTVVENRMVITPTELLNMLHTFVNAIATIGKAERGQKTMLDALVPALAVLEAELDRGAALPDAMHHAASAAQEGAEATIPMLAQRGRASYLGERTIGHQDPGATSAALIVRALAETLVAAQ